ncbi:MAG: TlpA disulfide reductase family protein [Rhodoferax sp.]
MKTLYRYTLGAVLAGALLGPALALDVGQAAPAFELPGVSQSVSLSQFAGKTVYLDFWASWCGPCKQSFPWMNSLQQRFGAKGFQVVAINLDQRSADAQAFLKENPAQFTVAFDASGKTPKTYAIKGMPSSVLIGPDGKVLSQHTGFKAEQRAELEAQIQKALHP